jgi:hypothetical protein
MGSVANEKHAAARPLVRQWLLCRSDKRRDELVRELAALCAGEIFEGLRDGGGVWEWNERRRMDATLRHIALAGVQRALDTLADTRPSDFPKHIRACTAEVTVRARERQEAEIDALTPQQIYDKVVSWPRPGAASLLDRLSFDQRTGLIALIIKRADTIPPAGALGLREEPEDHQLWLVWYAARLQLLQPSVRHLIETDPNTPTHFLLDAGGELGPQPKNKRGEPINLAGPLLVKVFDVLTGLPGNRIPAPARSNTRLGRTFNVHPDVIARWRQHTEWKNLRVNIVPDGNGGVRYTFDLRAVLISAQIVMGKKRGPLSKPPE